MGSVSSFSGSVTDWTEAVAEVNRRKALIQPVYDALAKIQAASPINERFATTIYLQYRAISQLGWPAAYQLPNENTLIAFAAAVNFERQIQADAAVMKNRADQWLSGALNLKLPTTVPPTLPPELQNYLQALSPI